MPLKGGQNHLNRFQQCFHWASAEQGADFAEVVEAQETYPSVSLEAATKAEPECFAQYASTSGEASH